MRLGFWMRFLTFALAWAALCLSLQGSAQPDPFPATLELEDPVMPGELAVAFPSRIEVPWIYTVPPGAAPAAGGATLHWDPPPACDAPGVAITGNATQAIQGGPGVDTVSGVGVFVATATMEAPGEYQFKCVFTAYAEDAVLGRSTAPATAQAALQVDFVGLVRAYAPVTSGVAGPQRQIPFEIHIENLGNSRAYVIFELSQAGEAWQAIAPPPLVIDSRSQGGTETNESATFVVSTPFHNGPNSGRQDFTLTMHVRSALDNSKLGNTVQLNFTAEVDGLYVPGADPAVPLLLLVSGLAARSWQRRNRAA